MVGEDVVYFVGDLLLLVCVGFFCGAIVLGM